MQEDLSNFLSAALRGGQSVKWAREQAMADQSEGEMQTPAVLIVVPTRELGVQTSLLAYRLLGGGLSNPTIQPYSHPSRYAPGAKVRVRLRDRLGLGLGLGLELGLGLGLGSAVLPPVALRARRQG